MTDESNIQAAIDAGVATVEPKELVPGLPYFSVVIPRDGSHEVIEVDTEKYALIPRRAHGVYGPADVEAFVAITKRHFDPDATTIWVHPSSGRIVAVFNDASPTAPGFRDHRAVLDLVQTEEWKHWISRNKVMMSQVDFAEHIEEGMQEIVSPPAADMLELAQTIQTTGSATFRSAIRLQDGTIQTQYDEDVTASAGRSGQLSIPPEFTLGIAPFLGEPTYQLTARLRYRQRDGKLSLAYKLDRPEAVIEDALNTIATALRAEFHDVVYLGTGQRAER